MTSRLTMTYDFGTTSLKVALVDGRGGIVAHTSLAYPVCQPRMGWAEQDPTLLWDAAARAGIRALGEAGLGSEAVGSVVFIAPWKGIIPVAADGTVLRDASIWMDARAVGEARELNERYGEFVGTGQEYWPRLMWLKRNAPEVWAGCRWIMGMNTYLKWKATGVVATEPSDDFVRSGRPALRDRYAGILEAAGLAGDLDKFPPSTSSDAVVGYLTEDAARHLGLAPGVPVHGGFGDLAAITLGAGPLVAGATHVYLGTSSWFVCVVEADAELEAPLRFAIDDRHDGAVYCLQSGCLAVDWIVDQVYSSERAELGPDFFSFLDARVAEVAAGSDGLLATHWLTGELPPLSKNAKGVYLNLTTLHDRRHMVRSMMEGVCYAHRSSVEWFESQTGERVAEMRAVGGGASSPVWMQILADVLGRPVVVPEAPRFVGTIGARACVGPIETPDRAGAGGRGRARRFEPDPERGRTYDRMFAAYRKIHPALLDLFEELNATPGAGGGAAS